MPYVKLAEKPYSAMRRLLLGHEMTGRRLAKVLGCSYSTAARRLDGPDTFTLGELVVLSVNGHIPIEEIRAAIRR